MSNRVDYFNALQSKLAIPAGRPVVYIDGRLCGFLEVVEVVRAAGPSFGSARLLYNPAVYDSGEALAAEQIETVAAMGKSVSIRQLYDGGIGSAVCHCPC